MSLQELKVQCREKLIEICEYKYTENYDYEYAKNHGLDALTALKAACLKCRWNVPTCCRSADQLRIFKVSILNALSNFTQAAGETFYTRVQTGHNEFHETVIPGPKNEMVARMHDLLKEIIVCVESMQQKL